MGWDYWTYQSQPAHFIEDILEFLNLEASAEKAKTIQVEQARKLDQPSHA